MSKPETTVAEEKLPETTWGRNFEMNQTQKETHPLLVDDGWYNYESSVLHKCKLGYKLSTVRVIFRLSKWEHPQQLGYLCGVYLVILNSNSNEDSKTITHTPRTLQFKLERICKWREVLFCWVKCFSYCTHSSFSLLLFLSWSSRCSEWWPNTLLVSGKWERKAVFDQNGVVFIIIVVAEVSS